MFKRFYHIDELKQWVAEDKQAKGVGASTLDRYPIRFVLFDNFRDCYDFVDFLQSERGAHVESVDQWIDSNYPDLMITCVELADRIAEHIKKKSPKDCVIAPFSELARFYDNENNKSFDALLKTIKAIQSDTEAVKNHMRVYIPIVGLEGKMETFSNDSQAIIWRLITENNEFTYKLILTENTDFGVKGIDKNYTVVNNIREWLKIWKDTKFQVSPQIICKSRAIYANAHFAQPDNAFSYETCKNAYEFLAHGLALSFGGIQPLMSDGGDEDNWGKLAERIDVSEGFNFNKFVRSQLSTDEIDDYKNFIRLWFSHADNFDRWLLARYYANKEHEVGYICSLLRDITHYSTNEFIEKMACAIPDNDEDTEIRCYCLKYASSQHVRLSNAADSILSKRLLELQDVIGYSGAMKHFTGISIKEKEIAIQWLGSGKILDTDVKDFYPDLYCYLKEGVGVSADLDGWIEQYFYNYKVAKICNRYTQGVSDTINACNASEANFHSWYDNYKNTYTTLKSRKDIEVFYWVDGLGIDWVPLVKQIISEKKEQLIFLNEIKIARANLPTKTDINKADILRLLPKGATLEKMGDLDALAHQTDNIAPFTINKEIELVRNTIEEILQKFIGKKIAIISDHGLTYMSQLVQGLNMAGVESDHHGRVAIRPHESEMLDTNYITLDDKKTLCALKHASLCAKVPSGQGSHGGCTPEEVLVPIFIISSSPVATDWDAELLTPEVSGSNPRVHFSIKNIPSTDMPIVFYNGCPYKLHNMSKDIYESDNLILDANENRVMLSIGSVEKEFKISVTTGVQENNLFDF